MSSIKGKTVAITGAASGIGQAIARRFIADGATVVGSDLHADGMKAVEGMIRIEGDVTNPADVKAMVDLAVDKTGQLDVLINNAGIGYSSPVATTDVDIFALLHRVHVLGCMHGMRYALPVMQQQGSGHIINVVSRVAEVAAPGMSAYASAKAAMWSLTRIAAAEVKDDGILVNMMFPGTSNTGMTAGGALGDPSKLGAPDQQYDTFLMLATLEPGSTVGQVWFDQKIYPMFSDANDLGDVAEHLEEGAAAR